MKSIAKLRYLRIAPRKVRMVADLIRGKKVEEAETTLRFVPKRGADPILSTLKSAIAAAKENFQVDEKDLYISKITVDEGPKLKRWRARARGVAYEIQKKSSHITIELDSKIDAKEKKKKAAPKAIKARTAAKAEAEKVEDKDVKVIEEKEKFTRPELEKKKEGRRGLGKIFRRKVI